MLFLIDIHIRSDGSEGKSDAKLHTKAGQKHDSPAATQHDSSRITGKARNAIRAAKPEKKNT
jgi:hypothetical protein